MPLGPKNDLEVRFSDAEYLEPRFKISQKAFDQGSKPSPMR